MVSCPDSLVWQLTSRNTSKMVKRGGRKSRTGSIRFSREAGNVANVSTFKHSGFANSKTIDLSISGSDITLNLKTTKASTKPAKASASSMLKKPFRKSVKTIRAQCLDNGYRADLTETALARYGILNLDKMRKKGADKDGRKLVLVTRGRKSKKSAVEAGDDSGAPGMDGGDDDDSSGDEGPPGL